MFSLLLISIPVGFIGSLTGLGGASILIPIMVLLRHPRKRGDRVGHGERYRDIERLGIGIREGEDREREDRHVPRNVHERRRHHRGYDHDPYRACLPLLFLRRVPHDVLPEIKKPAAARPILPGRAIEAFALARRWRGATSMRRERRSSRTLPTGRCSEDWG